MVSAVSNVGVPLNRLIAELGSVRTRSGGDALGDAGRVGEAASTSDATVGKSELTEEERRQVDELSRRDVEVRRHEQAHKSAAGSHATGGPSFEYQTGPDGKRYAVGGEVGIDTSPVDGDPTATIRKMQQIRAAALAPAEPSSQDRRIAAETTRAEQEARAELSRQENGGDSDRGGTTFVDRDSVKPKSAGHSQLQFALAAQLGQQSGRYIDVAVS